jgi:GTP-binding protein
VVNKWDLAYESVKKGQVEGNDSITDFRRKFTMAIRKELFALSQFPIIFVSAKTGYDVNNILHESVCMFKRASQSLSTGILNRVIQKLLDRHSPATSTGKHFKIYYAVHCGTFPFRLKLFCNRSQKLLDHGRRYLENGIRDAFDLSGCPMVFEFIDKEARYTQPVGPPGRVFT